MAKIVKIYTQFYKVWCQGDQCYIKNMIKKNDIYEPNPKIPLSIHSRSELLKMKESGSWVVIQDI